MSRVRHRWHTFNAPETFAQNLEKEIEAIEKPSTMSRGRLSGELLGLA